MCREEVRRVLKGSDTILWEDLSELKFLTMCIKESMIYFFLMKVVISVIYQISQFILLFHMFDLLKIISHYTYTYTQIAHSLLSYLRLK